ncbi:MAG: hypothetical protein H6712_21675 [Myxococcales bacterium]|nr:hypothetical protein [Myxococcales bacterium]
MSRVIVLGCIFAVVACSPRDTIDEPPVELEPSAPGAPAAERPRSAAAVDRGTEATERGTEATERDATERDAEVVLADASGRIVRTPNRCEGLQVQIDEEGRHRYKRVRRPWTEADRTRFAELVTLVAKEMDADPRLIRAWAMRESTYRPHAMHVLNPDIEAATAAWQRFHYSPAEEAQLQALMERVTAQDPEYWQAKARLHQVQTFRDNPYLDDVVMLEVIAPDGSVSEGSEPAWAFGYGPFGFNPAYFVPVWDSRAPPWVFCDDDGLVAIITAVWAARTAQRECDAQGFGGSYASVNRRFSQGHCGEVGERASFRARAHRMGLDPDARAKLGRKWPRRGTDRGELLRVMRHKAVAAGLLTARGRPPGA